MSDYPRIRATINAFPIEHEGQQLICLQDPERIAESMIFLPQAVSPLLMLLNGQNSVRDVQADYMRQFGQLIDSDAITQLIDQLDENYFLDSERLASKRDEIEESFKNATERPAAHAGQSYHADAEKLRYQLTSFFTGRDGPAALPQVNPPFNQGSQASRDGDAALDGPRREVRGIIAPHIDLRFGGPCYAWAYKELAEAARPDLFVIFGTCHGFMRNFFALTRKDFATPLGSLTTDREFVDALLAGSDDDLLADEMVHKLEHTIEFQTVFLQHLFGGGGPVQIAPILVGSFDFLPPNIGSPFEEPRIRGFLEHLRRTVADSGKRVCFVASVDLCHIGQRYGDPRPPTENEMRLMADEDIELLRHVEALDAEAFFHAVQPRQETKRICGLAPIYSLLQTIDANQGRLLKHGYIKKLDANGGATVSYCSMSFA